MEDKIREVAYRLWEEEGCPNGKDSEHWTMAEVIVMEKTITRAPSKKKATAKKKKVVVAKKKAPAAKKKVTTKKVSIKKKK